MRRRLIHFIEKLLLLASTVVLPVVSSGRGNASRLVDQPADDAIAPAFAPLLLLLAFNPFERVFFPPNFHSRKLELSKSAPTPIRFRESLVCHRLQSHRVIDAIGVADHRPQCRGTRIKRPLESGAHDLRCIVVWQDRMDYKL